MTEEAQCRLCLKTSQVHKRLYLKNGDCDAEAFEIVAKYFHPIFLSALNDNLPVLCSNCWNPIFEFYKFQDVVYKTQAKLLKNVLETSKSDAKSQKPSVENPILKELYVNVAAETSLLAKAGVATNGECGLLTPDSIISTNSCDNESSKITSNVETCPKALLNNKDSVREDIASDDDEEYDSDVCSEEEYEEPIGVFTGGEFDKVHETKDKDQTAAESDIVDLSLDDDDSEASTKIQSQIKLETNHIQIETTDLEQAKSTPSTSETSARKEASPQTAKRKLHAEKLNENIAPNKKSKSNSSLEELIIRWKHLPCCPICSDAIPNYMYLRSHLLKNHRSARCNIQCCQRSFNTWLDMEQHIRGHVDSQSEKQS